MVAMANEEKQLSFLLANSQYLIPAWDCSYEEAAEDLIANGVTVPKRGRWVWNGKHWECSNCRHDRLHDLVLGLDAAYCPYCGADMREGKGDDEHRH